MLVLSEGIDIRTAGFGMEEAGEDLGYIGIEGGYLRDLAGLVLSLARTLLAAKDLFDGLGGVSGAGVSPDTAVWEVMIDEDLVVRISAVAGGGRSLCRPPGGGRPGRKGCRLPVEGPVDTLTDRRSGG